MFLVQITSTRLPAIRAYVMEHKELIRLIIDFSEEYNSQESIVNDEVTTYIFKTGDRIVSLMARKVSPVSSDVVFKSEPRVE